MNKLAGDFEYTRDRWGVRIQCRKCWVEFRVALEDPAKNIVKAIKRHRCQEKKCHCEQGMLEQQ